LRTKIKLCLVFDTWPAKTNDVIVNNSVTKYRHCNMPFSNKDKAIIKKILPV